MNRRTLHTLVTLLLLTVTGLISSGCSQEDDIDAIFTGKTWFIVGGKLNGQYLDADEIRSLYDNSSSTYHITFAGDTFSGSLSMGSTFSGQWSADGKKHRLLLTITNKTTAANTPLDNHIYQLLQSATHYSGDENILQIKSDDGNYLALNANQRASKP